MPFFSGAFAVSFSEDNFGLKKIATTIQFPFVLVGVIVARSGFKVEVTHAARQLAGNGSLFLLLCWLVGWVALYSCFIPLQKQCPGNSAGDLFGMVKR